MKKILYVDPMSWNNLGVYDKSLLDNITKFDKYFYCNKSFQFTKIEKTKIIREYSYEKKRSILKGVSYIFSQYKLYKLIKNEKIKLIHIQWIKIPWLDYVLIKLIKKMNCKIIFTAHNILPHDTKMKYYKIYKKIYDIIDGIIVHTEKTKKELERDFKINEKKVQIIPHGLLSNGQNSKIKKMPVQKKNKIVFTLLGNLSLYKGVDILIEAWSNEVLSDRNDCQLIIAGSGKIDLSLIKNKSNIYIKNKFLSEVEIEEILNNTDIMVLPYRKISQSGVLLTALEKKIPILVSNVGGLTDPFKLGEVGWILQDLNSKKLKELIEDILENKSKITQIKNDKNLWENIHSYYSWTNIGEQTQLFYQKVDKNV